MPSSRQYKQDYYHHARRLGLCGRCKQRDALPAMAYCASCRSAIQHYNHLRQGEPKKEYWTKYARAMKGVVD